MGFGVLMSALELRLESMSFTVMTGLNTMSSALSHEKLTERQVGVNLDCEVQGWIFLLSRIQSILQRCSCVFVLEQMTSMLKQQNHDGVHDGIDSIAAAPRLELGDKRDEHLELL